MVVRDRALVVVAGYVIGPSTMPGASKVNDQWGSTAFTDVHRRPRMEFSRNDRPSVNSGGVQ